MISATTDSHTPAAPKVKDGFDGQRMVVLPPNIKRLVLKATLLKGFYFTAIGFYPEAIFHDRQRKLGASQYIFLYCTKGKGHIHLQGRDIELKANHFFILPKQVPHHYHSSTTEPWSIYWVHFIGEQADQLYYRYEKKAIGPGLLPYDAGRIAVFDEIISLVENSFDIEDLEISNILLQGFIASFIYRREINPALEQHDAISVSIAFMKKNLGLLLSVEILAVQHRLSVSHFSRLFRKKTGISPIQYFNQLKIQKSCQELYFSDRAIKTICNELGFEDPYYFSRLFKTIMGLSPSHYRNQHRRA